MDLFRSVSKIDGDFSRKLQNFPTPAYFAPADWVPLGVGHRHWGQKNWNDGSTRWSIKFQDRFSRLDTISACDIHPAIHVATAIAALCYASREQKTLIIVIIIISYYLIAS